MSLITNLHAHNYTAIQVEFLQNTTTAREGTDVKLDIQYLLNPPNVTLQKPIIVTVMVVNGSATGKLQLSFYCMLYYAFSTAALIQSQLLNHFISLLTEGDDFSLANSTLTFDTNVTADQGTNDSNIQVLAIHILDEQLVERTESFVISGNVTKPASFVPGGDLVTVNILDNGGTFEQLHN